MGVKSTFFLLLSQDGIGMHLIHFSDGFYYFSIYVEKNRILNVLLYKEPLM